MAGITLNDVKEALTGFFDSYFKKREQEETDYNISFFKTQNGRYGWIGVYSNSFRDDDGVPEIVRSESHKNFVAEVDAGRYDYPDLLIWHREAWKFGKATTVAYDEVEDGIVFAIAAGLIDEGKEYVAEAFEKSGVQWQMSHAMPYGDTIRNEGDPTIFDKHRTTEVSVLLPKYAANHLTGFGILMEDNMIPDEKRQEMKTALGVGDEFLDNLEQQNSAAAMVGKQSRDYKESSETEETETEEAEAQTEAELDEEKEAEEVEETEATEDEKETDDVSEGDPNYDDLVEEIKSMREVLGGVITALKETHKSVMSLAEEVDGVKKEQKNRQREDVLSQTPTVYAQYGKIIDSIIGTKEAVVDESQEQEESLEGPEETDKDTVNPLLSSTLLGGMINPSTRIS